MLIPDQIVTVKVNGNNKKYYENKGYVFDDSNKICKSPVIWEIKIHIDDLSYGSATKVLRQCNRCGKIEEVNYNYKHFDFCRSCGNKGTTRIEKLLFTCVNCGDKVPFERIAFGKCSKCRNPRFVTDEYISNISNYIKTHCKICGSEFNANTHEKMGSHHICRYCWHTYSLVRRYEYESNKKPYKRNNKLNLRFIKQSNNCCDICNSDINLEVHHTYSVDDFPEYVNDTTYMVVLCKSCHLAFHRMCGKKMNVPEQYLKFKERYKGPEYEIYELFTEEIYKGEES